MSEKFSWSSGYWLNINTLKVIDIEEHATDVKTHPDRYGLKAKDVEGLDPMQDRNKLVFMAMDNGWIRVRPDNRGNWISFQYRASQDDQALDAIYYFVHHNKISADINLKINNLETEHARQITGKDFDDYYDLDMTSNLFDKESSKTSKEMQDKIARLHTKSPGQLTPKELALKKKRGKGFGSQKERPKDLAPWQINMLLRTSESFKPLHERVDLNSIREQLEDQKIQRILRG